MEEEYEVTPEAAVERLINMLQQQKKLNSAELSLVTANKVLLANCGLVSEVIIKMTEQHRLVASGLSLGLAAALKKAFPSPATAPGKSPVTRHRLRHFANCDACHPDVHYFLPPEQLESIVESLQNGQYLVVCGGRQTGKSTLGFATVKALEKRGYKVYFCQLNPVAKDRQNRHSFWKHMHELLESAASRRGNRSRFGGVPAECSRTSFCDALLNPGTAAGEREVYVFEEASDIPSEFMQEFVDAARHIKNIRGPVLAMMLIGVHSLRLAIDVVNSGGQVMDIDGDGAHRRSSPPSLSPFKSSETFEPEKFSVEQIEELLMQHITEQEQHAPGSGVLGRQHVPAIASSIHEWTGGVKGMSGFCLSELTFGCNDIQTADQWEQFAGMQLANKFVAHGVSSRVVGILRWLFPSRATEQNMELHGQHSELELLRWGQQVVLDVVHHGKCSVTAGRLANHLLPLLAEGLLVVVCEGSTGIQLLLESNPDTQLQVAFAAPLMAAALLSKLCMSAQYQKEGPNFDTCWLLRQVIRNLDLQCLLSPQGSLASCNISVCSWRAQTYLLSSFILKDAYSAYRVAGGARSYTIQSNSCKHLDVLIYSEGQQTYGLELLVAGTASTISGHITRAEKYSQLHASEVDGTLRPCMMHVVNIDEVASGDFEETTFDNFISAPVSNEHVRFVHVALDRKRHRAKLMTASGDAVVVECDRASWAGNARVYRRIT